MRAAPRAVAANDAAAPLVTSTTRDGKTGPVPQAPTTVVATATSEAAPTTGTLPGNAAQATAIITISKNEELINQPTIRKLLQLLT